MLKIAMLSKWHVHAEGYAKEFMACEGVSVTHVWDEDKARGEAWAKELGCKFEPDLDTLLASGEIDAVSVGTPTSMHKEVICKAAKAKKAIFTEKVLAITNNDAEEIAAVVNKSGVPFCIALRRRTEPRILRAKELVESGALGEITQLRIRDAHDGASTGWLPDSFYNLEACGGGAMMDLGAHPMYLSDYFLGLPKTVSSVFSQSMNKGVDDNCVSLLCYENGAIAIAETGFVSKNCPFSLELCGKNGHLTLGDDIDGILLHDENGKRQITNAELSDEQIMPIARFVKALAANAPQPFTVENGVALTRLMDAAYRADKEGKTVSL